MHDFLKSELLAVEGDRGVDVVDDVADLNRRHERPPCRDEAYAESVQIALHVHRVLGWIGERNMFRPVARGSSHSSPARLAPHFGSRG